MLISVFVLFGWEYFPPGFLSVCSLNFLKVSLLSITSLTDLTGGCVPRGMLPSVGGWGIGGHGEIILAIYSRFRHRRGEAASGVLFQCLQQLKIWSGVTDSLVDLWTACLPGLLAGLSDG